MEQQLEDASRAGETATAAATAVHGARFHRGGADEHAAPVPTVELFLPGQLGADEVAEPWWRSQHAGRRKVLARPCTPLHHDSRFQDSRDKYTREVEDNGLCCGFAAAPRDWGSGIHTSCAQASALCAIVSIQK